MNGPCNRSPRRQRGGALLVAMIMIFMMSILGISTMRSSTLERSMATNSIQTQTVFQTAESSTEIALNNWAFLQDAWDARDTDADGDGLSDGVSTDTDLQQDIGMQSEVTVRYIGDAPLPGYGISVGSGNTFMALHFEAEGSARHDDVRASARVLQGGFRPAPNVD